MNSRINDAIFSLIDEIEKSDIVKNLYECKKKLKESSEAKRLIVDFNNKKEIRDNSLQQSKIALYNNSYVKEYLFYEQALNYIIIRLNKSINKIIGKKGCM